MINYNPMSIYNVISTVFLLIMGLLTMTNMTEQQNLICFHEGLYEKQISIFYLSLN